MKDEWGKDGNIMIKFAGLREKTCSYLIDGDSKDKKSKGTKAFVTKRKLKFKKL